MPKQNRSIMDSPSHILRKLREEKNLPLRKVAEFLEIDQAILSKIERGQRKATRSQILKLAEYYDTNVNDLMVAWLSDKIISQVEEEDTGSKVLQAAEERIEYIAFKKIDREQLKKQVLETIKSFSQIQKAWIYGSFSREDDGPKSDIDIAIKTDAGFSYFDLAEVQFHLENNINRKIDVGFVDSFKPYIFEHVKPDLKLIYER